MLHLNSCWRAIQEGCENADTFRKSNGQTAFCRQKQGSMLRQTYLLKRQTVAHARALRGERIGYKRALKGKQSRHTLKGEQLPKEQPF